MMFLNARDGCRLCVETTGSGKAIVLIPGLGGAASFWSAMAPGFADGRRVISYDHRGAGRSDRPDGAYEIEILAEDLIDMLDALGIERADLVGHSTGGAIAQVVARNHPARVGKIVLSATWHRPDTRFQTLFRLRLEVLESLGPESYARLTQVIGFRPDWLVSHPELVEQAAARARADLEPISVSSSRIQMLLAFQGVDDLAHISQETLVLGATDDMIVAYAQSVALANGIPSATLLPYDGGHFFPRVYPDQFVRDVRSFLDGAL
ncbi:alpha/beta fold hydrolase [Bradyrhizobium sp.]|jgi:aminoacrylate hydrolase|uniref:alpha/beta fold hydrolase n=1 Tax=Bradyrhizobium sp. TaxID=376 RepID=UPI002DDD5FFA|nr:alpha/beta fold hydrolase [Bradyrhizobium sp.]HEV2160515.1 alpha/beta fold hydrolase [Bradyrhizobium sp.]